MPKFELTDGFLDLQASRPNSRVELGPQGVAIIDPNQPPIPEVIEALKERMERINAQMGQSTLLDMELSAS